LPQSPSLQGISDQKEIKKTAIYLKFEGYFMHTRSIFRGKASRDLKFVGHQKHAGTNKKRPDELHQAAL
jgi:hypothetical protein